MAVLRLTMGLLPLPGLPVPSLGFPVNPEPPQAAALIRTVSLASPAPLAYEETHAAPAATNLDQKQSGLQRCKPSEAVIEIGGSLGFRSFRSSSSRPEVAASGLSSFYPFNCSGNQ